jgi:hypothetical protein
LSFYFQNEIETRTDYDNDDVNVKIEKFTRQVSIVGFLQKLSIHSNTVQPRASIAPQSSSVCEKKTRVVNLTTPVLKQMTIPATIWETRHCHLNMPLFYFFVRIDCQAPGRIQDLHNRGYQEAQTTTY